MTATTLTTEPIITMAFTQWTTQQLEDTFKLNRLTHCVILEEWVKMDYETSEEVIKQLDIYRKELDVYAPYWNEMELRLNFIGPLLHLVNYRTAHYQTFAERSLSVKKGNFILNGNVDFMVASGKYEPKQPFFFFHVEPESEIPTNDGKYKKEKGTADDPIAQVLSAMLAGQTLNEYKKPIYGAYVIGRMWFFMVLRNSEYCISKAYVASNDDIVDIYRILVSLKEIILRDLL